MDNEVDCVPWILTQTNNGMWNVSLGDCGLYNSFMFGLLKEEKKLIATLVTCVAYMINLVFLPIFQISFNVSCICIA